jgi:hypothetical protein
MNNVRKLVIALGARALAAPLACFAQQQTAKFPRIDWLAAFSLTVRNDAFRQGLRQLRSGDVMNNGRFTWGKDDA